MKRNVMLLTGTLAFVTLGWFGFGAARDAFSRLAAAGWPSLPGLWMATRLSVPGPVVVERVQRLGRLETCRFQEQVTVEGRTGGVLPTWIAGDRLLFVGQGEVVAGVDLSRVSAGDVAAEGDRVAIRLPRGEILHARLDNRRSEVCDRQSGLFTGPDRRLETRVRLEAEERLQQAALEAGILHRAEENARATLRQQFSQLGFREIRFL